MRGFADNLLTQPLICAAPRGALSLPAILAALARDEIDSFPSIRPHQSPAWHMFLVQLAALAMHRAGLTELPSDEEKWRDLLRGLTPDFAYDEPWRLVVEDRTKPAFLQPPVPQGVKLENLIPAPDTLDLLITAKNHDLKQGVARRAALEDWAFALVSVQTGGTYNVQNGGCVRAGNIYAPRALIGLAPRSMQGRSSTLPAHGAWFGRDVLVLLEERANELARLDNINFPGEGGIGLTWIYNWPAGVQFQLNELDIWFIEICRRIRCNYIDGNIIAHSQSDKKYRVAGLNLNGNIGDPWTPQHKSNEVFAVPENGFGYRTLTKILLGERIKGEAVHNWVLPVLLKPHSIDGANSTLLLVAQGVASKRTKSVTAGFHSRILPIGGEIARLLGPRREELHELAQAQMKEIGVFDAALRDSLILSAVGGDYKKLQEALKSERKRSKIYSFTAEARLQFDRRADEIFFERLWARFAAQEVGREAFDAETLIFALALFEKARIIFDAALPAMPCAGLFRPRAEARARSAFEGKLRVSFPLLFQKSVAEDEDDAA